MKMQNPTKEMISSGLKKAQIEEAKFRESHPKQKQFSLAAWATVALKYVTIGVLFGFFDGFISTQLYGAVTIDPNGLLTHAYSPMEKAYVSAFINLLVLAFTSVATDPLFYVCGTISEFVLGLFHKFRGKDDDTCSYHMKKCAINILAGLALFAGQLVGTYVTFVVSNDDWSKLNLVISSTDKQVYTQLVLTVAMIGILVYTLNAFQHTLFCTVSEYSVDFKTPFNTSASYQHSRILTGIIIAASQAGVDMFNAPHFNVRSNFGLILVRALLTSSSNEKFVQTILLLVLLVSGLVPAVAVQCSAFVWYKMKPQEKIVNSAPDISETRPLTYSVSSRD